MDDAPHTTAVEGKDASPNPATSRHLETGAHPSCDFCHTDAEWHGTVPGACTVRACDLHRATFTVDADAVGVVTTWRALSRDRGQLVALAVLILVTLLLPGCDAADPSDPYTPLFVLAVVAGFLLLVLSVVLSVVLALTRLGRRFGIVETRDDVDAEADSRSEAL